MIFTRQVKKDQNAKEENSYKFLEEDVCSEVGILLGAFDDIRLDRVSSNLHRY